LAKEKQVWDSGFARYRDFLYQLFPGAQTDWFAIQRSNRPHVLTFNYDQAFEIAFLDRFNSGNKMFSTREKNRRSNLDFPQLIALNVGDFILGCKFGRRTRVPFERWPETRADRIFDRAGAQN
jgi:hypothetical protein